MRLCDWTLPGPEENLACDEALLDLCDETPGLEVLRFWEPDSYFVVLGYANTAATEADLARCGASRVPIFRRCSGGGTVLQGPGCLNYSLLLSIPPPSGGRGSHAGSVRTIASTNRYVMERHRAAVSSLLQAPVEIRGHTDLAIGGLKISGNAQRRKRNALIFHGCFLLNLDIDTVERLLPLPSSQPDYRFSRSHRDFLLNLKIPPETLKRKLAEVWDANLPLGDVPAERIAALVAEKYTRDDWNLKF